MGCYYVDVDAYIEPEHVDAYIEPEHGEDTNTIEGEHLTVIYIYSD